MSSSAEHWREASPKQGQKCPSYSPYAGHIHGEESLQIIRASTRDLKVIKGQPVPSTIPMTRDGWCGLTMDMNYSMVA